MKGDAKVIDLLNDYLKTELTGLHQYIVHSRILKNWGIERLGEREGAYAEEEKEHVGRIADRILFLEGHADFQTIRPLAVGDGIKAIVANDAKLVRSAVDLLRAAIPPCEKAGDFVSRSLFREFLADEEEHLHFLEIQLRLIDEMGEKNYAQSASSRDLSG